jgi:hypothetical protein
MQSGGSRKARPIVTLALLAALVGPATGCSLLFVKPPAPPEERGEIVRCTSSAAAPVIDMIIASLQVVRTLIAFSATDEAYAHAAIPRPVDIGLGIGLSGLFAVSSGYGFSKTNACREAVEQGSYYQRPRPRPRAGRQPPGWRLGPPPPSQQKLEEQEEEAAVRARMVERARAAAPEQAGSSPDAGAAPDASATPEPSVTAKPPERWTPPVRQRTDTE